MIGIGHTFSKSEQRGVQPGVLTSALYNIKYKLYFYRECAKIKFRGIGIKIYIKETTIKLTNPYHYTYHAKTISIPIPGELIAVFLSTILFSFYNPNNLIPGTSDSLIISHTV